jgi:hypothetical protein
MPYYEITSQMTDKDSPLNQTLFDYIRENLNYLKALATPIAAQNLVQLGDCAGVSFDNTAYSNVHGVGCQSVPFYLPNPGAGNCWVFVCRIYLFLAATIFGRLVDLHGTNILIAEKSITAGAGETKELVFTGVPNTSYCGAIQLHCNGTGNYFRQAIYASIQEA